VGESRWADPLFRLLSLSLSQTMRALIIAAATALAALAGTSSAAALPGICDWKPR